MKARNISEYMRLVLLFFKKVISNILLLLLY